MTTPNPIPARRGSLVGPLVLLLLGVLFLVSNLRPDLSVWRLFSRYWPFLLIFWGGARLLEYILARFTSRPIARGLSGGEVFLAVAICLLGSGFGFFERREGRWGPFRVRGLEMLGENYDFPVQASRKIPPNATVVINNLQGNVRVVGADEAELKITGQKSIRAFDRSSAEQADKSTVVEIIEQGTTFHVRTNQDRVSGDRKVSTDLIVTVPKGVSLGLEGRLGDFDVKDVAGPVDVNSQNAGVRLTNIAKNVRVSLRRSDIVSARAVKGNVDISGRGRDVELEDIAGTVNIDGGFSGSIKIQNVAKPVRYNSTQTDLHVEKVPGKLEMDLGSLTATEVVGPFRLNAQSKDVRLEEFSKEVEISTRRGDIQLRLTKTPLSGAIHAESSSGNIRLEAPAGARFQLQATTGNGRVENEFGESIQSRTQGHGAEMKGGTVGATPVHLSTKRGTVVVRKGS